MSSLYAAFRQKLITAGFTWAGAPVYASLMGSAYAPNFETDTTVANVPSGGFLTPSVALTGLAAANGTATAANVNFGTIATSGPITGILLTLQPGSSRASTDQLVMYLTGTAGFGVAANNYPVSIVWPTAGIWRP